MGPKGANPGAVLKAISRKTIEFLREHLELPTPAAPVAGQNGWTESEVKGALREVDGVSFRKFKADDLPGARASGGGPGQ